MRSSWPRQEPRCVCHSVLYGHYRQRVRNKPRYSHQTWNHSRVNCSLPLLSFHLFFIGKWRGCEINIIAIWNKIQVNLYLQTYHIATCLRCQFCELVKAVTFGLVSLAGKGPNVLLAIIYCYIYKSNAKKCSRNWRMGGWTGCESDPESAALQTAKSCFIMYLCQRTWVACAALEGCWSLLGRGMLEELLHLVPWHPAVGWL